MSCSLKGPVGSVGTGRLACRPGAVGQPQLAGRVGLGFDGEVERDAVAENQLEEARRVGLIVALALRRRTAALGSPFLSRSATPSSPIASFDAERVAADHERAAPVAISRG